MLKRPNPTRLRRFAGAAAIASLAAVGAYGVWNATPVLAQAPAPAPAPAAAPAPQGAVGAALAGPSAARVARPAAAPTVQAGAGGGATDIVANIGSTWFTPAPAPILSNGPSPNASPNSFAAKFNADKPMLVRGKVLSVETNEPNTYMRVADSDGKVFRVQGGSPGALLTAGVDFQALVGADVIVRGYEAWDTSCTGGGCLMNGRDITFLDGKKVFLPNPTAGSSAAPCPATCGYIN